MKEMWAYVYEGEKVVKKKVPLPSLRPNDVLVKVKQVSVCGSDFHIFDNDDWAKETITPGIVIGHEGCGVVEETGDKVTRVVGGDFVALESHYACPDCEAEGKTGDDCTHYGIIGVHGADNGKNRHEIGGVFAEYIAIPDYCCHKINRVLREAFFASLLEPAGNSWEIIRFLQRRGLPENFAVYGCGPHGLNLQLFARYAGIANIFVFEPDPWRREFAEKFGAAHHVCNPETMTAEAILQLTHNKRGFDAAIDMAGNIRVVEACKQGVRDGGLILLFGLPQHESLIIHGENFAQIIFHNEEWQIEYKGKKLFLRGFTGRTSETWTELLSALQTSEFLRKHLTVPLKMIGDLHELTNFIRNRPKHFHKIGLYGFS